MFGNGQKNTHTRDTLIYVNTVRNVTFSLPVELLRRAKVLAAERDISLNALVKDALGQVVDRSGEYREAGERLLLRSDEGLFDMSEDRAWTRAELYD
jgi:predicted transcriptional regulator